MGYQLSCPFCALPDCPHLFGWTSDGRNIEPRGNFDVPMSELSVRDTDRTINTGTTTRVYRPTEPTP